MTEHPYQRAVHPTDSENLRRTAQGIGMADILLTTVAVLLAVGVVLGILGYNLITDRLDNIETYTGQTAAELRQQNPVAP